MQQVIRLRQQYKIQRSLGNLGVSMLSLEAENICFGRECHGSLNHLRFHEIESCKWKREVLTFWIVFDELSVRAVTLSVIRWWSPWESSKPSFLFRLHTNKRELSGSQCWTDDWKSSEFYLTMMFCAHFVEQVLTGAVSNNLQSR